MKRSQVIKRDLAQIEMIENLTAVFAGIASLKISQIKDQVVASQRFFDELWQIYTQLRVDPTERYSTLPVKNRNLLLVITGQGGLSGDIDDQIIDTMLKDYKPPTDDILVIGAHGANKLSQRQIQIERYFSMPESSRELNLGPIMAVVSQYKQASVYYQYYVSLAVQQVAHINLISAIQALGQETAAGQEVISNRDYIFEPSVKEVADYLESIMMGIALSRAILDSQLAQYASRFNAMSAAKQKAVDLEGDERLMYNRSRRSESDERLKEAVVAVEEIGL